MAHPATPPFRPDPDIMGNAEGNARILKHDQQTARDFLARQDADTLATAEAVAEHLTASGEWHRKGSAGYLTDDHGSSELYLTDDGDTLIVNVVRQDALGTLIDALHLDPESSVARVARIITAATAPEED